MSNFKEYSIYYDFLYEDKDYDIESTYVLNLLKRFSSIQIDSVLELGFGTAKHAENFTKYFSKVYGIERSKEMFDISEGKKINNFFPFLGSIEKFSFNIKFDAVISLFHVISYLNENEDLLNCFTSVSNSLHSGGVFLFDVWFTPAVFNTLPSIRVKRLENENFKITRIAEPLIYFEKNIVDVNYEIFLLNKRINLTEVLLETHSMRHFSIPEIKFIAMQTGFEFLHAEEFMTGENVSNHTWGACFILRKI